MQFAGIWPLLLILGCSTEQLVGRKKIKGEIWHTILRECCPLSGNVFYLCDAEQSADILMKVFSRCPL